MSRAIGMSLATAAWLVMCLTGIPYSFKTGEVLAQQPNAASGNAAAEDAPEPLSEDELEVLVARIALYPDELVALVSSASLFPLQVVEAARYLDDLKKNKDLKPKASWDGSIVSLLNYPDIVAMMSGDLDWTQSLGQALANQQKDVLVAIQQLRDKAVADGVIKSDDKIRVVQDNDNVVIQSASREKIYVPQYPPEMLYEPGYAPQPIGYYPDPYPDYTYPSAPFFAAAVTGAVFAAAVDWNDWGVWGGGWNGGGIDIDCDHCMNNIDFNGKLKLNDIDWKNADRSKIKFDRNQFANLDRNSITNSIKADTRNNIRAKANVLNNNRTAIGNKVGKVSVQDIRNNKIAGGRIDRGNISPQRPGGDRPGIGAPGRAGQAVPNRRPERAAANVRAKPEINRPAARPRPGGHADVRPRRPSALGHMDSGRRAQFQSNRGRQAMGGGHRGGGGHRAIHRGGGRHR